MSQPSACIIFEAINDDSAIAKVAADGVRAALAAGWRVTVVAKLLHESLRDRVRWRRLYVPPRGFALQWLTARHFIRRSLGDERFDVVHAHQPQVNDLADVFQCHFLTRAAFERKCLEERPGIRPGVIRAQQRAVLHAEDYHYRRVRPHTRMLFCSELTRREFHRLYGPPARSEAMAYAFPPIRFATPEERRRARAELVGEGFTGLVVGYLGGVQERKGYRRLVSALAGEAGRDVLLLMGGQYTERFTAPELGGRLRAVGLVRDTARFYAACDVLAVPSYFEPLGLVAWEAAARGVPVIATPEVGALPHLLEYGTGVGWRPGEPLAPIVRAAAAARERFNEAAVRMARALGAAPWGRRLIETYEQVLREKRDRRAAPAPSERHWLSGAVAGWEAAR